jgi:predicted aldo/keto reductase-like oxidoreductase
MKRRAFLRLATGAAGTATLASRTFAEPDTETLPRRKLGRTGFDVSIVGFAGFALKSDKQPLCTAAVRKALQRGVNYLDVAPAYGRGTCETKLGVALEGVDRDSYYLACKTKRRDRDGAREELERSLKVLKTDHFDVYQLHHLSRPDDVDKALGPGGCMETILKAKEEGKVRAIGFSAHTTKAAMKALKAFSFDTVMFPINYVEYYERGYGKDVLALAREKGTAVLAIKVMSAGGWPKGQPRSRKWWYRPLEDQGLIDLAFRWSLSHPGVVTGFSPAWLDLQAKAATAGIAYRPVDDADAEKLRKMAKGVGTLFKREEDRVAIGRTPWSPYPFRPRERLHSV